MPRSRAALDSLAPRSPRPGRWSPLRPIRIAALTLAAVLALGAGGCPLTRVKIKAPLDGALLDDPGPVQALVRTGKNFEPLEITVRLDGVDLIDALGLIPPFSGAGGVVVLGGGSVTISDFDYDVSAQSFHQVRFAVDGLAGGDHLLEAEAVKIEDGSIELRTSTFARVDPFTLELTAQPSTGLPRGALDAGVEGLLVNASLGDPAAGPRVPLADGGELRPGFVQAAEGRITAAP